MDFPYDLPAECGRRSCGLPLEWERVTCENVELMEAICPCGMFYELLLEEPEEEE